MSNDPNQTRPPKKDQAGMLIFEDDEDKSYFLGIKGKITKVESLVSIGSSKENKLILDKKDI
ncbi:hypothetical protein OAB57_02895, partial [Bacteriovoracaceae bacterium]|nr:hypothetical protein [Bacteriovoracaceae bacterium]